MCPSCPGSIKIVHHPEIHPEYGRDLYDGLTQDTLAYTKYEGTAANMERPVGMVFDGIDYDSNVFGDALGDCHEGGDCGFAKINNFIDSKIKPE